MKTKFFSFVFLVLNACVPLHAKDLGFSCQFNKGTVGDLKNGVMKHADTKKGDLPPLSFTLNTSTKQAAVIGNLGKSKVEMVSGKNIITFVEVTPAGNFVSTSVYFPDNQKDNTTFHATHTRNISFHDGGMVSSYFGSCKMFDL
jgi:hypothetical protein